MPTVQVSVWVPAVLALLGALVGSIAPVVVGVIQSRSEQRRDRLRLATQLAIEDLKSMLEIAKTRREGGYLPPISALVAYHAEILEALSKREVLSPARFVELRERSRSVFEALAEGHDEHLR